MLMENHFRTIKKISSEDLQVTEVLVMVQDAVITSIKVDAVVVQGNYLSIS